MTPPRARRAGVLLHPTSLPGAQGGGELDDHLTAFLDWAAAAGMRLWQVLPLNPPGYGASPYGCLSSFAGNPLLLSPQRLVQDGLLEAHVPASDKFALLRTSWRGFASRTNHPLRAAFDAFVRAPEQREWLGEYALFMALKAQAGGAPWWEWAAPLMRRDPHALREARSAEAEAIRFWEFVQFLFFRQWNAVREAAHARGIRIMGDVPIYVAADSADVWSHRELFQLDGRGLPTHVAGVPPDYFSETGQRWGNPLYRWDAMRETHFQWFVSRVKANLRFADVIRLDHFRGFAAYWEIPAAEATAVNGKWIRGPGLALFDAIREALGGLPLVAEDLGFITDDVHELRRAIGIPGMKVLQFGLTSDDSPHLPHRFEPDTVAYTGTHDNDTARGWYDHATARERATARAYLGTTSAQTIAWDLIRAAYTSTADTAIVPVQDLLGLGSDARMNTPGEETNNWTWRLAPGALTSELAARAHRLAILTGR